MKLPHRRDELRRQKHFFSARDDNKKPGEHQQKPAI